MIGSEENFKGVVDLLTREAIVWNEDDMGMTYKVIDVPEELNDVVDTFLSNVTISHLAQNNNSNIEIKEII